MDAETEVNMKMFAREVAQEVTTRMQSGLALPASPQGVLAVKELKEVIREVLREMGRGEAETDKRRRGFPACGVGAVMSPCGDLAFAPMTATRFYRSGRTLIDVIEEGKIPVAPGSSVVLSQRAHPAWAAGCFALSYRLANNGNNHDDIKIEWFLDSEPLDLVMYGSEFYGPNGDVLNGGKRPLPLAGSEQCCIGAFNRLRVRISHTGNANAIESVRVHVDHAGKVACCSACAVGQDCQKGCQGGHG